MFRAGIVLSALQQLSDDVFVVRQLIGGCALAKRKRAFILTGNRPFGPSR